VVVTPRLFAPRGFNAAPGGPGVTLRSGQVLAFGSVGDGRLPPANIAARSLSLRFG